MSKLLKASIAGLFAASLLEMTGQTASAQNPLRRADNLRDTTIVVNSMPVTLDTTLQSPVFAISHVTYGRNGYRIDYRDRDTTAQRTAHLELPVSRTEKTLKFAQATTGEIINNNGRQVVMNVTLENGRAISAYVLRDHRYQSESFEQGVRPQPAKEEQATRIFKKIFYGLIK